MRLVVTGASGFVGRPLGRELARAGHTGVVVARRECDPPGAGWEWRERDALLHAPAGGDVPAALVHLEVKQHVVAPTPADCAEFERVNVQGTQDWLRWCTERGVRRFVYFSTIKAVGDTDRCQDETADSLPSTPYGRSKREGENLVLAWAAADPARSALVLRPAVVYGPGNTANVFSMVRAIDRGAFFLAGQNENIKSLVSLRNLCAAVSFLLSREQKGARIFNLVDRESFPVRRIAGMIADQLGRKRKPPTLPLPLVRWAARTGDVVGRLTGRNLPLNSPRLRALLETTHFSAEKLKAAGFIHPQSTEEGLAEMIAWYRRAAGRSAG
jgi:nucleoside-diphosphate-sugar epimerase